MARKRETYKKSTNPEPEDTDMTIVLPPYKQPALFALQTGLFTENRERSWVEFCVSREQEPKNTKEVASYTKAQLDAQINKDGCDRIERIEVKERLWEISRSRVYTLHSTKYSRLSAKHR
jgi:hypothetical protein